MACGMCPGFFEVYFWNGSAWERLDNVDSWSFDANVQEATKKRTSSTGGLAVKFCGDIVDYSASVTTTLCRDNWLFCDILAGNGQELGKPSRDGSSLAGATLPVRMSLHQRRQTSRHSTLGRVAARLSAIPTRVPTPTARWFLPPSAVTTPALTQARQASRSTFRLVHCCLSAPAKITLRSPHANCLSPQRIKHHESC